MITRIEAKSPEVTMQRTEEISPLFQLNTLCFWIVSVKDVLVYENINSKHLLILPPNDVGALFISFL